MAEPTAAHRKQAMQLAAISRLFPREAAIAQALADAEAKPPAEPELCCPRNVPYRSHSVYCPRYGTPIPEGDSA